MRVLRTTGWVMIWTGGLILAFLAYQLVGTNFITARAQEQGEEAFAERVETLADDVVEVSETIPEDPEQPEPIQTVATRYTEPEPAEGEAFARIIIPKIEVDEIVFSGVSREVLKQGPGHMEWTPLPGQPGNAVLSGHRTTYGAPFSRLDELEVGDEMMVDSVIGESSYVVQEILVVRPTDVWVTDDKPGAWLTLTTCHPRFSARQRLVVVGELVEGPNLEYVAAVGKAAQEVS